MFFFFEDSLRLFSGGYTDLAESCDKHFDDAFFGKNPDGSNQYFSTSINLQPVKAQ